MNRQPNERLRKEVGRAFDLYLNPVHSRIRESLLTLGVSRICVFQSQKYHLGKACHKWGSRVHKHTTVLLANCLKDRWTVPNA